MSRIMTQCALVASIWRGRDYVILRDSHQASRYAFFEVECMAIHPRTLAGSENHRSEGCAAILRRLGTLAREVRSATKEPRQGKRADPADDGIARKARVASAAREEPLARSPTTQLQALQQAGSPRHQSMTSSASSSSSSSSSSASSSSPSSSSSSSSSSSHHYGSLLLGVAVL